MSLERTITGRIGDTYGNPHVNPEQRLYVFARHVDGRVEQLGAYATLSSESYSLAIVLPGEGEVVDPTLVGIELRVYDGAYASEAPIVARSPIVVAPQAEETIDLVIGDDHGSLRGPTELRRFRMRLEAVGLSELRGIRELDPTQLQLLAARTGIDPRTVALLRRSIDLAEELDLDPESDGPLLFALGRQKLPMSALGLALAGDEQIDEAIAQAVEANIVEAVGGELPDTSVIKDAIDGWFRGDATSHLTPLIDLAGLSYSISDLIQLYLDAESAEAFWEALLSVNGIDQQAVEDLRLIMKLSVLTQRDTALISGLFDVRGDAWDHLQDLAGWSAAGWEEFIASLEGGEYELPERYEEARDYAQDLVAIFEEQLPTAATILRLAAESEPLPYMADIKAYYLNNLDFDLDINAASAYHDEHSGLSGDALAQLAKIQRVHRLAPSRERSPLISTMLREGYDSAHAIAATTGQAFKSAFGESLDTGSGDGEERALEIHDKAQQMKGVVDILVTRHSSIFDTHIAAVGDVEIEPTIGDLLGIDKTSGCAHERSIFGAPAYLADLLTFLRAKPSKDASYSRLLDRLLARRPDLEEINLGTKNTFVLTPAIDIANEILEAALADKLGVPAPAARQTSGSSEERRASPEHCVEELYGGAPQSPNQLRERTDHLSFPFDLHAQRHRRALELLGVDHARLFEALAKEPEPLQRAARERLGIVNLVDASDIEGGTLDLSRWGSGISTGSQLTVQKLLELTDLDFEELQPILAAPTFDRSVAFARTGEIETAYLSPISFTDAEADLLRRALKLTRRCGWSFREVERGLALLGAGTLDGALVAKLAEIERLHRDSRVDRETLINWAAVAVDNTPWGSEPSYRERAFPQGLPTLDASHQAELANALSISPAELASFGEVTSEGALGEIFRVVGLARVLDMSVETVHLLLDTLDIPMTTTNELASALRELRDLETLEISPAEFAYLISNTSPLEGQVSGEDWLTALQAQLVAPWSINSDVSVQRSGQLTTLSKTGETTDKWDATAISADGLLDGGVVSFGTNEANTTKVCGLGQELAMPGDRGLLVAVQLNDDGTFEVLEEGKVAVDESDQEVEGTYTSTDGFSLSVSGTSVAVRKNGSEVYNIVVDALAEGALNVIAGLKTTAATLKDISFTGSIERKNASTVAAALASYGELTEAASSTLTEAVKIPPAHATKLVDYLVNELIDLDISSGSAEVDSLVASLGEFHRLALLSRRLVVAQDELPWMLAFRSGGFDLGSGSAATKANLRTICRAMVLKEALDVETLYQTGLFDAADDAAFVSAFCARVESASQPLVQQLVERFQRPQTPAALAALVESMETFDAAGVLPEALGDLFAVIEAETAEQALELARKGRQEEDWLEQLQSVNDVVRIQQRDALTQACLIHGVAESADKLYSELLIDTEMMPCQQTSRIKAATATVQQFVQRLFLRLEGDEEMTDDDAQLWEWMRNYRVWEANRKVFVYPENWLNPDWRDDKTPFFKELEAGLAQGEISEERVEELVLEYLEKLHAVSHLDIAAICQDEKTVHVVGRTKQTPAAYYYRKREDEVWGPWEALDFEIESEQVMLAAHNRRLYLLWPSFAETTVKDTPRKGAEPKPPERNHAISLVWSEYKHGRWSPQRRSKEVVSFEKWSSLFGVPDYVKNFFEKKSDAEKNDFTFLVTSSGGDLLVEPLRVSAAVSADKSCRNFTRSLRFRVHAATGQATVEFPGGWPRRYEILPGFEREGQEVVGTTTNLTLARHNPSVKGICPAPVLGQVTPGYRLMGPSSAVVPTLDTLPVVFEDQERVYIIDRKPFPDYAELADPGLDVDAHAGSVWNMNTTPSIAGAVDAFAMDPQGTLADSPMGKQKTAQQDAVLENLPPLGLLAAPLSEQLVLGAKLAYSAGEIVPPQATEIANIATMELSVPGTEGTLVLRSGGSPPLGSHQLVIDGTNVPISTVELSSNIPMPDIREVPSSPGMAFGGRGKVPIYEYRFTPMHYPFSEPLLAEINIGGIWAVYRPDADSLLHRQQLTTLHQFETSYLPVDVVDIHNNQLDFEAGSPTGVYNWELFFHIPMLLAQKLRLQGEHEAARRWLHAIFDPTRGGDESAPTRYWRFAPLYQAASGGPSRAIEELLALVDRNTANEQDAIVKRKEVLAQVRVWAKDCFSPFAIARLRQRAHMPAVVMAYLDNLLDWADALFRRDTMESINEATQLYMLAAEMLGVRPEELPGETRPERSFKDLDPFGSGFSNAFIEVENSIMEVPSSNTTLVKSDTSSLGTNAIDGSGSAKTLYFGVPYNDRLLDLYWGRVADRLFKIRHCQNIEGVERALALFEPPIDPALLIRAKAMGLSIGDVLKNLGQALPAYRFETMLATARTMCRDVQQLEGALLAALEKRDAEELSRLRANHEVELNRAIERIRRQGVKEAKQQCAVLRKRRQAVMERQRHYASLPEQNSEERSQLSSLGTADNLRLASLGTRLSATVARALNAPQTGTASLASPLTIFHSASNFVGMLLDGATSILDTLAHRQDSSAQRAGIRAGQQWRKVDWDFQAASAARDVETLDKELLAAEIRLAMAEHELENHRKVVSHSKELRSFVMRKFSNFELYDWMVGELCRLHKGAFDVASELAQRAEKCLQFDLGEPSITFLRPQLATNLRSRLFFGEELASDLRKMEAYHLEKNTRKHEITRHISLAEINPQALLDLRSEGRCDFELLEGFFDVDLPGHYLRRIKSVALSIPSTAGPYTPVHAQLRLHKNRVRVDSRATDYTDYADGRLDHRSVTSLLPRCTSMVTSSGEMDSGLFEANLNDPRYLPFEGAGAVSSWSLDLPSRDLAGFDYDSISDVVVHLRYTALPGGQRLTGIVTDRIEDTLNDLATFGAKGNAQVLIDIPAAFPTEWQAFISGGSDSSVTLPIEAAFFPYQLKGKSISVRKLTCDAESVTAKIFDGETAESLPTSVTLDGGESKQIRISSSGNPAMLESVSLTIEYTV